MTTTNEPIAPSDITATYFRSWVAHDWDALRAVLADDVTFEGPMATIHGGDQALEGLRGMSQILDHVEVQHVFIDGDDVLTWFDLHTKVADPVPTANWSHVEEGRITRIRVVFDARSLAPPD